MWNVCGLEWQDSSMDNEWQTHKMNVSVTVSMNYLTPSHLPYYISLNFGQCSYYLQFIFISSDTDFVHFRGFILFIGNETFELLLLPFSSIPLTLIHWDNEKKWTVALRSRQRTFILFLSEMLMFGAFFVIGEFRNWHETFSSSSSSCKNGIKLRVEEKGSAAFQINENYNQNCFSKQKIEEYFYIYIVTHRRGNSIQHKISNYRLERKSNITKGQRKTFSLIFVYYMIVSLLIGVSLFKSST